MNQCILTSESVSCGHPDKLADQVSDAILDAIIAKDPRARVACETLVKSGMVLIAGEITTDSWVDIEQIARQTIVQAGYNSTNLGFDGNTCAILSAVGKQSADIAQGVDRQEPEDIGAGDQGMMFGYASNETDVLMPAPITYAHKLMKQQALLRENKTLSWLGPDAKSQLSFVYENDRPVAIDTVVLSTQHHDSVDNETIHEAVMDEIILPMLPQNWITKDTKFLINPTGRFVIGGPTGDCGLTGRKIIVDTYGGLARHGGGAFSGKDPSKVDRSGAYAARYVAKNLVAAGLADRCEVQISYAIGVAEPTSINVQTYGTGKCSDEALCAVVRDVFDLRPGVVINTLQLLNPIYLPTATYGHFGRNAAGFTWEETPAHVTDALQQACKSSCAC